MIPSFCVIFPLLHFPLLYPFPVPLQKGKKCTRMQKSRKPVHLSYAGCRSVQAYKPNYCGVCTDGRCCVPRRTRTASVLFQCPGGGSFDKAVMFIYSCKCGQDCGHLNEAAMPPQKWLYGDTHTSSLTNFL